MHSLARRLLRLARGSRDKHPPMAWLNPGETTELAHSAGAASTPTKIQQPTSCSSPWTTLLESKLADTDLPNGFGSS